MSAIDVINNDISDVADNTSKWCSRWWRTMIETAGDHVSLLPMFSPLENGQAFLSFDYWTLLTKYWHWLCVWLETFLNKTPVNCNFHLGPLGMEVFWLKQDLVLYRCRQLCAILHMYPMWLGSQGVMRLAGSLPHHSHWNCRRLVKSCYSHIARWMPLPVQSQVWRWLMGSQNCELTVVSPFNNLIHTCQAKDPIFGAAQCCYGYSSDPSPFTDIPSLLPSLSHTLIYLKIACTLSINVLIIFSSPSFLVPDANDLKKQDELCYFFTKLPRIKPYTAKWLKTGVSSVRDARCGKLSTTGEAVCDNTVVVLYFLYIPLAQYVGGKYNWGNYTYQQPEF